MAIKEYLGYGLVRSIPYVLRLGGTMLLLNGLIERNFVRGAGGVGIYIMGSELDDLIKQQIHLPKKSRLEEATQDKQAI